VVSTPEMDALSLAPRRCEELMGRGISREKIGVVLNRWHRREVSSSNVEKLLGYPVSAVFENDYVAVSKAARAHQFVNSDTKLGKSFASFARKIAGVPDTSTRSPLAFLKSLGERSTTQPWA
jgi:Flp pilus assembly CpaE family ATPase